MTIKQQGGIFGRNPTFNNVDVEGTLTVNGEPISDFGTMAQQDANNVNIDGGAIDGTTLGENTRSTGKFTTANTSSYLTVESSAGSGLRMYGSSGTNQWDVYLNSTNLRFSDNTGGGVAQFDTNINLNNSNLVIGTSGKGIDFSATSDAAGSTSELFDDYEEGTWTPELTAASGTFTIVTLGSGTGANYTKIGRVVTFQMWFETDAITAGTAAGDIRISLPFTTATGLTGSSEYSACAVSVALNWGGDHPIAATVRGGEAKMNLVYRTSVNGASSNIQVGDLGTGASDNITTISGTYIAA